MSKMMALFKSLTPPLSRYKGWYTGYQIGYNTATAKLTANDAALGYCGEDFTVHSCLKELSSCTVSVHHKV